MTQCLASLLLAASGFFLVSCCIIYRVLDRISLTDRSVTFNYALTPGNKVRQPRHRPAKSDLRQQYDAKNLDSAMITSTVQGMRYSRVPGRIDTDIGYDIHRCPEVIPDNYPMQWNVIDVLSNWNPDNTTVPQKIYQGVCALDWNDPLQQEVAQVYRKGEKPFLLLNHPELWKTAERWSHFDYLYTLLGGDDAVYRNEHSRDNHMPYWNLRGLDRPPPDWVAPTENVKLTYADWFDKAMTIEKSDKNATDLEHYYFRLNGVFRGDNDFLYDELPIFLPTRKNFFMPEPESQRGINCRFGSKGTIAETHYDFSRNFIVLLKGQKRYILSHPNQCENLELYPHGHPSARHSKVDWSNPNEWHTGRFPQAQVNEVILQPGDALYLPTSWFHFIVSLNLNYQCNARSGVSIENYDAIKKCGFRASS